MIKDDDSLPSGKDILNPICPEAKWDVSGLFVFDNFFHSLIQTGRKIFDCDLPIESIHGCYPLMWNNGRSTPVAAESWGDRKKHGPEPVLESWQICPFPVGCYLTFSNHLVKEEHLEDPSSNWLLDLLVKHNSNHNNGVIVASDILSNYIRQKYPELKQKASIVKSAVETPKVERRTFDYYNELSERYDRIMLHPDDGFNIPLLKKIADSGKMEQYEIIVNENCVKDCSVRKSCYQSIGKDAITGWHGQFHFVDSYPEHDAEDDNPDPKCGRMNYFHSDPKYRTAKRSGNFTLKELEEIYDMGFRHFKLQGRDDQWTFMRYDFIRYVLESDQIGPRWFKI